MERVFMGMWPAGKGARWVRTGALLDELDACRSTAILVEQSHGHVAALELPRPDLRLRGRVDAPTHLA